MKKIPLLFLVAAMIWTLSLAGCSAADPADKASSSEVRWLTDYDAALKLAQATNKLVVIDFFATWCGYCKLMDRKTFTDARVQQKLEAFVPLKIDTDKQPKLAAQYGIEGLPTMVVVDASGKPLATAVGFVDADKYLSILAKVERQKAPAGSSKP